LANISVADPARLPLADHVHRLVSLYRSPGGLELAENSAWPSLVVSSLDDPAPRYCSISDRAMATMTTAEREELNRLRRENRVLREEREILSKARHPGRT
jgi:hypothetical protein